MNGNRSVPPVSVVPILVYPDVRAAADWLCGAFGFVVRLWIGDNHRAQLSFGSGAVIVCDVRDDRVPPRAGEITHSVLVRVEDVDAHCRRAIEHGARVTKEAADYPYGERQYEVTDPWEHQWTFSQSIRDVRPEEWGGVSVNL